MKFKHVRYVLTDIEGTTTSVKFVYDTLFPYFRNHIDALKSLTENESVQQAFKKTVELAYTLEGIKLRSVDDILTTLLRWSQEDRKITPLKTVQGILWEKGYQTGEIKGHVYADVAENLKKWTENGLKAGVFSSGSVAAQQLIFGFSESGNLTPYFSDYFDTETGGKREVETYQKIATNIGEQPNSVLFLSDVVEELEAAAAAGFQTVQLVRAGTRAGWEQTVADFNEIEIIPS